MPHTHALTTVVVALGYQSCCWAQQVQKGMLVLKCKALSTSLKPTVYLYLLIQMFLVIYYALLYIAFPCGCHYLLFPDSHAQIAHVLDGLLDVRLFVRLDVYVAFHTLGRHHALYLEWILRVLICDELSHEEQSRVLLLAYATPHHP